jgi:hypothetical protein
MAMHKKKRKSRTRRVFEHTADVLIEIILLPFRIVWYLLKGFGKVLEAIFDGIN